MCLFISLLFSLVCGLSLLLGMLVAKWEPTPCYRDAYSVGTPNWAWAPACQDRVAGGHAGVGVISLGGALLTLHPLSLLSFMSFSSWVGF